MNAYFQNHAKGLEHSLYLVIYILSCETKFLVEDLVWSREAEALETEDLAVAAYKSLEGNRETSCKTEDLCSLWKYALLILL